MSCGNVFTFWSFARSASCSNLVRGTWLVTKQANVSRRQRIMVIKRANGKCIEVSGAGGERARQLFHKQADCTLGR